MSSKCQICLEDANLTIVTSCGHTYCRECTEGWMASHRSNRNCPICKHQLKKEEFQELTSGQCLQPSEVIPVFETEDEADPAIPPRPVLQPDVNSTTVPSRSDRSDQSSHVVRIHADTRSDESDETYRGKYGSLFYSLTLICSILQMIALLHLTLWIWNKDFLLYVLIFFIFVLGFDSLWTILLAAPASKKLRKEFSGLSVLVSCTITILYWITWKVSEARNAEKTNWDLIMLLSSVITGCLAIVSWIIHSNEDVRGSRHSRTAIAQMTLGLTVQLFSDLTFYLVDAPLPQDWWIYTLVGNLLTLASLAFFIMSVTCKSRLLSSLSSLIYLSAAGIAIYKFCIFAMAVDRKNKPMDGSLEANTVELFGHLIFGAAHLSVFFGKIFIKQ